MIYDISLRGKVAFVSGASKGIGVAIAKALASAGEQVLSSVNHHVGRID